MFKELTVTEWMEEIARGLEFRRLYGKEDRWAQLEALAGNADTSIARSGPNLIYSMQDDLLSSLHVPNPEILVDPLTEAELGSSPIIEAVDNQLIDQMKMSNEVEMATTSAYLWGTTVLKIGYDSEFGWCPEFDYGGQQQPVGMSLTQIDVRQRRIEFNEFEPGMPWVRACLPHDIVVPWGTRDIDSAPWIAHRVVRHIEDVKADPKYNTRGLKPIMSMADFVKSYQTVMKPYRLGGTDDFFRGLEWEGEAEYVELWEIHDKRTGKMYVIATQHNHFLRNDRDYLQIYGLPFVEVGFTPKVRNFWRTSDADYLYQAQAELTDISIQGTKQRRMNTLKFLYRRGAVTEQELTKLMSSDVGAAIGVTAGTSIGDTVMAFQPGHNQQLYQEADFVRSNARETTGFTKTQAGEYAGARTTGYEVSQVQGARQLRLTRRQKIVASIYCETMRKVNEIIFRNWKTPRVVQIMGQMGAMEWMSYTGTDLKGRYSYRLTFQDAPFPTAEDQQALAMQAYQMSMMDPSVDPIAARRFLSRSMRNGNFSSLFPGISGPQQGQPGQQGPRLAGSGQGGPRPAQAGGQGQGQAGAA
jgi:hypothetical protein